jgi:hypothetical protein
MGYAKVSDRRKLYAYNLGVAGTSYRTIQKLDQRRFGNQNTEMALGTISSIMSIGKLTGDPCFASPAYSPGRTLTYDHKKLILDALVACVTASTAELERKLQRAEATARTTFAHSSIDAAIRAAGITLKRVTLYNARRCPVESALARRAVNCYDVRCVLVFDASHIAADEAQRNHGRAPRGKAAIGHVFHCAGGGLVSVLAAMSIDGMDMRVCRIVVRSPPSARAPPELPPELPSRAPRSLPARSSLKHRIGKHTHRMARSTATGSTSTCARMSARP